MHQLTGDFYTIGEILGHTLKGIGMSLGISINLEAVTAQYVDVRLERKNPSLTFTIRHYTLLEVTENGSKATAARKKSRRKSSDIEL